MQLEFCLVPKGPKYKYGWGTKGVRRQDNNKNLIGLQKHLDLLIGSLADKV